MSANDGGPAFPFWPNKATLHEDGRLEPVGGIGMSLRDWFAGQALIGMLSGEVRPESLPMDLWLPSVALSAYDYADAMLAERAK